MMHDWWSWSPGGWGGMWIGPLFMLLVLVAVIAVGVALVRWMARADTGAGSAASSASRSTSAREILDRRFASGEIDADEYEARRRALDK